MPDFLSSARFVDVVLALTLLEATALVAWHCFTGRGPRPLDALCMLAAGAFLLLALRSALVGAGHPWIMLCLTGALVAHLADLARRWR
jgi:hypothetical protein